RYFQITQMRSDLRRHHRTNLLEHLAALLTEQLVASTDAIRRGAIQKAEIIANVIGKACLQAGTKNFPLVAAGGVLGALDDHGRGYVAKDEMAIPVLPGQMAGTDFRIDHQHTTRGA